MKFHSENQNQGCQKGIETGRRSMRIECSLSFNAGSEVATRTFQDNLASRRGRVLGLVRGIFKHFGPVLDLEQLDRILPMLEQHRDHPSAHGVSSRFPPSQHCIAVPFFSATDTPLPIPGSQYEAGEVGHHRRGLALMLYQYQLCGGCRQHSSEKEEQAKLVPAAQEEKTPCLATGEEAWGPFLERSEASVHVFHSAALFAFGGQHLYTFLVHSDRVTGNLALHLNVMPFMAFEGIGIGDGQDLLALVSDQGQLLARANAFL